MIRLKKKKLQPKNPLCMCMSYVSGTAICIHTHIYKYTSTERKTGSHQIMELGLGMDMCIWNMVRKDKCIYTIDTHTHTFMQ